MRIDAKASILDPSTGSLRAWLRLLRIHQWAKNALIFVPIFAAHRFDTASILQAFIAAASFSLAASSLYILNDLVDLDADRGHQSKRLRPLAAGTVSIRKALVAGPLLQHRSLSCPARPSGRAAPKPLSSTRRLAPARWPMKMDASALLPRHRRRGP